MQEGLDILATRAREVAEKALAAKDGKPTSFDALHQAMMAYRAAAVGYMAHPSVGDYVRKDALRHQGATRDAIEQIASLIDDLNDLR